MRETTCESYSMEFPSTLCKATFHRAAIDFIFSINKSRRGGEKVGETERRKWYIYSEKDITRVLAITPHYKARSGTRDEEMDGFR